MFSSRLIHSLLFMGCVLVWNQRLPWYTDVGTIQLLKYSVILMYTVTIGYWVADGQNTS
jgi:hypothetical protein